MNIEDLKGRLDETAQQARATMRLAARQTQIAGNAMLELTADPNWEIWERHIDAEKQRREQIFKSMGEMLLSHRNKLTLEKFDQAKMDLAEHEAWIKALDFAVNIAKDVIERGEKAIDESVKPE